MERSESTIVTVKRIASNYSNQVSESEIHGQSLPITFWPYHYYWAVREFNSAFNYKTTITSLGAQWDQKYVAKVVQ